MINPADLFFLPELLLGIGFFVAVGVGISRRRHGGALLSADLFIRDGIGATSIYVFCLLWYGLIIDMPFLQEWAETKFGITMIHSSILYIVVSRLNNLSLSARNKL